MKISANWLSDYVTHGLAAEELADRLTMAGLEVEEVVPRGQDLSGVVVGHVAAVRPHPNADRLTLCDVDLGAGAPVQIVCGAPNVAAGQKVPVATVGTTLHLPDRKEPAKRVPVTLSQAKIRGEVSNGMICAEDELGLSNDHSGILVLEHSARVGQPFVAYLAERGKSATDAVLDVAITPNRQDAISLIGIARDVAALTGRSLRRPEVVVPEAGGAAAEQVAVRIESPEGCGRYVALLVRGVRIQDSPPWLKDRLEAVGLRPRNNVVDVTNYVMLECGQPLHAFDFDQLGGQAIVVRKTSGDSRFTTLDDKERVLPHGTLMICDAERPVAIAGVMGGENSEVSPHTTNVLIESAYFDPSTIRRTAKALGLQTDASYRFERGVDPDNTAWAAARAAELIADLSGGTIVEGMVDVCPRPYEARRITLRASRVADVLGADIPDDEVSRLLRAIGFVLTFNSETRVWSCTVPSYRVDVEREIDLIEEVARLYGYDRIPEPSDAVVAYAPPRLNSTELLRDRLRQNLVGLGLREVYTNSLLPESIARAFSPAGPNAAVSTLNPVSQQMNTLRPSLLPGALRVVAHNMNHGQRGIRCFEFGHVFERGGTEASLVPGYREWESLLLVSSGVARPGGWDEAERVADVFDMKGIVDFAVKVAGHEPATYRALDGFPRADQCLRILVGDREVGVLGRVVPEATPEIDLRLPVYFAELDFEALSGGAGAGEPVRFRAIGRFPVVQRDLAVVVDRNTPVGEVSTALRDSGGSLLQRVDLFDIYVGDQLAPTKKSLAFSLQFGADRTLVDAEVDAAVEAILRRLEAEHGAVIR